MVQAWTGSTRRVILEAFERVCGIGSPMKVLVEKKIKTLPELARLVARFKAHGKKVVQCHGVFDLVHLGHIRHFKAARREGDILVVTVTRDRFVKRGPGRPVFNEMLRAETLASLAVTDYVALVDHPTAVEAINLLKPDVYAKGSDYKDRAHDVTGKIYEEEEAVRKTGGKIIFTDEVTFSSTSLINNHLETYPPETAKYLRHIARRYPIHKIRDHIDQVKRLKILVIGDAIIDQYHYCVPMGKSSKEPIVVNRHLSEESFAGGALATANHAAQLSWPVDLVALLGEKESFEDFIVAHLDKGIRPHFFHRRDAGTTVKRRYVGYGPDRKLFEVCYLHDQLLSGSEEEKVLRFLAGRIQGYDLVVVADFGHGLLTPRLIRLITKRARRLALNVQTNSANVGFNLVTKYPRADFVCVDEQELRLAMHDKFGDLKALVRNIHRDLRCRNVIVTQGPFGSTCYSQAGGFHSAPAVAYQIVDKVGAGDAFFAYTAPLFACGVPPDLVSFIGNAVGSLAVQIVCNREPVRYADLMKFITRLLFWGHPSPRKEEGNAYPVDGRDGAGVAVREGL